MRTSKVFVGLILSLILTVTVVFANSAIPQVDPDSGAVRFTKDTGITLVEEKIVVELYGKYQASNYKVDYKLKNIKTEKQSYEIWFVAKGAYHKAKGEGVHLPKIYDDEQVYEIEKVKVSNVVNWHPKISNRYIDPYSHKALPEPILEHRSSDNGNNAYEYYAFTVDFEPNEIKALKIEYSSDNGYLEKVKHRFGTFITQVYYLTPAAFYEGEVVLDIEVYIKEKGLKFASNLPLKKQGKNHYSGHFNTLPKEEITFTTQEKFGKIFATNNIGIHCLMMTFVLVAIYRFFRQIYLKTGEQMFVEGIFTLLFIVIALIGYGPVGGLILLYIAFECLKIPIVLGIVGFLVLCKLVMYHEKRKRLSK